MKFVLSTIFSVFFLVTFLIGYANGVSNRSRPELIQSYIWEHIRIERIDGKAALTYGAEGHTLYWYDPESNSLHETVPGIRSDTHGARLSVNDFIFFMNPIFVSTVGGVGIGARLDSLITKPWKLRKLRGIMRAAKDKRIAIAFLGAVSGWTAGFALATKGHRVSPEASELRSTVADTSNWRQWEGELASAAFSEALEYKDDLAERLNDDERDSLDQELDILYRDLDLVLGDPTGRQFEALLRIAELAHETERSIIAPASRLSWFICRILPYVLLIGSLLVILGFTANLIINRTR